MIDREEWRPVVGFEGLYEVSSLGQVRSVDRTVPRRRATGTYPARLRGRLIAQTPHPDDLYLRVWLSQRGVVSPRTVHSLVADAFLGPRPDGQEVLHGDSDGGNNRLDNLRYGTRVENREDARAAGRLAVGEAIAQHKLTTDQARQIRAGLPGPFPISARQLRRVRSGEAWRHV